MKDSVSYDFRRPTTIIILLAYLSEYNSPPPKGLYRLLCMVQHARNIKVMLSNVCMTLGKGLREPLQQGGADFMFCLRAQKTQATPLNKAIHSFIHSFINSGHFYSAPSSPPPLRGAPDYSTDSVSEFHAEAHRQLQVKDLPKVPT